MGECPLFPLYSLLVRTDYQMVGPVTQQIENCHLSQRQFAACWRKKYSLEFKNADIRLKRCNVLPGFKAFQFK